MPTTAPTPRNRVSGIQRATQILELLSERQEAATAYDIARSLGAPLSTVYGVTDELVDSELLVRDDDNRLWLGPRIHRFGLACERRMDLLTAAKQEMSRLSAEIGETVQVCRRDGPMMVVVAMAAGNGHFRIASDIGTRVPLNWTASGRLLLGHLPTKQRQAEFTEAATPSPTGTAETNPRKLAKQAGDDFAKRLAVQMGTSEISVACIAAPIRNQHGECDAALSIVLPERKAAENMKPYGKAVQSAAAAVERALGCEFE